jgi:8-oxo-dGTP pyrophosphatase MutT (NUDIX family)
VSQREVVSHPGAVAILALDDDDRVVMVNQYRHPVGRRLDELPAGLLDVAGESALEGAKRELFEEAALRAEHWEVLVDLYPSPGMSDESIRIFLARGLSEVGADDRFSPEHEELTMTVSRVPLAEAAERALSGELTNAAAVAGVLAAFVLGSAGLGLTAARPVSAPWPARPDRVELAEQPDPVV